MDRLGHHAGDNLLIEFSRRISALLGPDDQLARLAGDEFAVLARRPNRDEVVAFAEEIVRAAGRPVTLFGGDYSLGGGWDLAPGGEGFLLVRNSAESEASQPRSIEVVLNWRQELERRVPVRSR